MSISLNSNIAALHAQRRLNEGSETLSRVYERLSSGQRINRASDDAAGLSVASALRSNSRVLTQAIRNANDGVSALSIAEGSLNELLGITTRIKELAEQSANGVYSTTQRSALDHEAQALRLEYNRILATSTFNGEALFSADGTTITLQVGTDSQRTSRLAITLGEEMAVPAPDGTFAAGVSIAVGAPGTVGPMGSGDFDGDGNVDLITGGLGGGSVLRIQLGNGNGTFSTSVSYTAAGSISSTDEAVVADFDHDGRLDVALSASTSGITRIFLGNGNGSFAAAPAYTTNTSGGQQGLAAGDINADGNLDLITSEGNSDFVNVLLGNGNGTFKALTAYAGSSGSVRMVAAGDLNADGYDDIVETSGTTSRAFLGSSDGTLVLASTFASNNRALQLADVDGDGALDVIASSTNNNTFTVNRGNGNGTFRASISYAIADTLGGNYGVVAKDLNGDGAIDIAVTKLNTGTIGIYVNSGSGSFAVGSSVSNLGAGAMLRAADFNGDGALDLFAANLNAAVAVFMGNKHPTIALSSFSLRTQSDARIALDSFSDISTRITRQLGSIGAFQSQLQIALSVNATMRENTLAAEARISDADIALESSLLVRTQILQQAASAVLAQANQQPALALQLLKGG